MGIIKDLINSFWNAIPQPQTLKQLALAGGLSGKDAELLNATKDGVSWKWASDETGKKNERKAGLETVNIPTYEQPNHPNKQIQSTHERDVNNDGAR